MNDHQTLALKPVYLPPPSQNLDSTKPSAALRGATSAFAPKITTSVAGPSPVSVGARLAAFTAGTTSRQQTLRPPPQAQQKSREGSPTRGRLLAVNDNAALGAARSSSSSNTAGTPVRPALQARSSSTLAARHVTVHSHSPQRSANISPSRHGRPTLGAGSHARDARSTNALSGAIASMATNLARDQQLKNVLPSTQIPILRSEKVPVPHAPAAGPIIHGDASSITTPSLQRSQSTGGRQFGLSVPQLSVSSIYAQPTSRPKPIPMKSQRQTLEESLPTTAMSAATKAEEGRGRSGLQQLSRSANSPNSSFLRGSTQGNLRQSDDYWSTMTVNDLADAMVASSLASSRAVSPQKSPPPNTRRRSRSIAALYEIKSKPEIPVQRKPRNPPRAMKQTLRKQSSSDDDEVELAKRGRRHWMRKHPNKHSEGDRKRWRDKVTELERKRYEGVFAANRGILIGLGYFEPSASALSDNSAIGNQVVNVVVRDIWERSRLPREVLKEIYDLVSPEEAQELNREQFVVGMWLVDQRLKGRKLPVKVSASVWASVRHSHGIKIRNHHA